MVVGHVAPAGDLIFRLEPCERGDRVDRMELFQHAHGQQDGLQLFDHEHDHGQRWLVEVHQVLLDHVTIASVDQFLDVQILRGLEVRLELLVDERNHRIPGFDLQLPELFGIVRTVEDRVPVEKVHHLLDQLLLRHLQRIVDERVQQRADVHRGEIDVFRLLVPFVGDGESEKLVVDGDQLALRCFELTLVEQDLVAGRRLRGFGNGHLLVETLAFTIGKAEVGRSETGARSNDRSARAKKETIHRKARNGLDWILCSAWKRRDASRNDQMAASTIEGASISSVSICCDGRLSFSDSSIHEERRSVTRRRATC